MDRSHATRVLAGTLFAFLLLITPAAAANTCGDTNNVCQIDTNISSDTTWIDGNVYVIIADVNVTGSGTDLTIQPGAVVKYAPSKSLIVIDGGRIVANGTADKNIIFTSCKDQRSFTGSTNQNTSNISGCTGTHAASDYNTALWIKSNANMTKSDSFSYLRMIDGNTAIRLDLNVGSIHDSNFDSFGKTSALTPTILLNVSTDINIYNNNFSNLPISTYGVRLISASFYGEIHDNTTNNAYSLFHSGSFGSVINAKIYKNTLKNAPSFALWINFSSDVNVANTRIFDNNINATGSTNPVGITFFASSIQNTTEVYNNRFSGFSGGSAAGITITAYAATNTNPTIYNNLFTDYSSRSTAISIAQGQAVVTAVSNTLIYNNTFANFSADSNVFLRTYTVMVSHSTITRNIFANIGGKVFNGADNNIAMSNNAYFQVATIGTGINLANDQNSDTGFTTDPFIADRSDRNFLLNTTSTGGAKLVGAGGVDSNNVDTNNYFNLKTTQLSNKLDTQTIDIGYHYDQNAPYVQVLSPSDSNTLAGTQTIDFNVESAYGTAAALTARLAYATTPQTSTTGGTQIVSQALSSYSCSAGPVFRCSYAFDFASIADGNYFIALTGTDNNGSRVDNSDNNFQVANDSTAPVTTADYNNAWQNTDANVGLSCTDTSGCALTQYRVDSDSTSSVSMGAWTTYTGTGIQFTSDGNWAVDYNSKDSRGNTETTHRIYILIDKTLPTLSLTITNLTVNGLSASFSYSASATSGIKKYWISTDGGTAYIDNGTSTDYSFSIGSNVQLPATVRVYIKAQNNADINTAAQAIDIKFESASGSSTKLCGNNVCDKTETAATCPLDCESTCGDKACTHIENSNTCPIDCAIGCGNQICESTENSATCPVDCGYTYDEGNPSNPPIEIIPQTNPETGTPKQCTKNADCDDDNLCTANRCIKNVCYAVFYPDNEPCDVGSVCQNHACIKIAKPYVPPTQTDPVFIASVVIILLVLATIAYEYFKK